MTQFNLTAALNGNPVVTRIGNKVKVICLTNDGKLLVKIYSHIGSYMDTTVKVNLDGSRYSTSYQHAEDIFMVA